MSKSNISVQFVHQCKYKNILDSLQYYSFWEEFVFLRGGDIPCIWGGFHLKFIIPPLQLRWAGV